MSDIASLHRRRLRMKTSTFAGFCIEPFVVRGGKVSEGPKAPVPREPLKQECWHVEHRRPKAF